MRRKTLFSVFMVISLFFGACSGSSVLDESSNLDSSQAIESSEILDSSSNAILAHWKFQNVEEYYTGDIDIDDLRFIDLSGNGNDLVVESEGFADSLDNFLWDTGCGEGTTSLKFNNTLELAESVDPYSEEKTSYSGAYVSGKYLKTISDAPLNFMDIEGEWTVEIVFKLSPDWNNAYNRYTGIFSQQGISEAKDEPFFSMATAAASDSVTGKIGTDSSVDLQFVYVNKYDGFANRECGVEIFSEEWVHYMVVCNGKKVSIYINGIEVETIQISAPIFSSGYGWEVGVGRKDGKGEATMNTRYDEGLIRRLFCGSISEIKFSSDVKTVENSLFATLNNK